MIIWPAAPAARRRIETAFMLIVEAFLFENLCSELWIIRYVPDVSRCKIGVRNFGRLPR
jgi:hypothetical protein